MRRTGIIIPSEFKVVEEWSESDGSDVVSGEGIDAEVEREGNLYQDSVFINVISGRVGGDHYVHGPPPSDSPPAEATDGSSNKYVLRSFSTPMEAQFSFSSDPNSYMGLAPLNTSDSYSASWSYNGQENAGSALKGKRPFSFQGEAYCVSEISTQVRGITRLFPCVFKWNGSLNWELVSVLPEPVEDSLTPEEGNREIQTGSPDVEVVEGKVFVAYKTYDSYDDSKIIRVFSSEDLINWQSETNLPIQNTLSGPYDKFRLRIAYGGGNFMVAFYATKIEDQIELRDFRTYSSPNLKFWDSSSDSFSNLTINANGSLYSVRGGFGLDRLFEVDLDVDSSPESRINYNVRFDLFYDNAMGSFVIFKAADGPNIQTYQTEQYGSSDYVSDRLIAIKTEPASFKTWEICLEVQLTPKITGYNTTEEAWNERSPLDESNSNIQPRYTSLKILDLCVVPMDNSFAIVYSGVLGKDAISQYFENSVVSGVFEAAFVPSDLMPLESYENTYIGYGKKSHPDFVFFCTPINSRTSRVGREIEVGACLWRSQVLYVGDAPESINVSGQTSTKVLGPWTNSRDSNGFTSRGQLPASASLVPVEGVSPRTQIRFKIRFESFPSASTSSFFLYSYADDFRSIKIELKVNPSGQVFIDVGSGDQLIVKVQAGVNYDFHLGNASSRFGASHTWVSYKTENAYDPRWIVLYRELTQIGDLDVNQIVVGNLDSDPSLLVETSDLQHSELGEGRPLWSDSKFRHDTRIQGFSGYVSDPSTVQDPFYMNTVRMFSPKVEIWDGTVLDIKSSKLEPKVYSLSRTTSKSLNSVYNLNDSMAGTLYDFTHFYNRSQGTPLCFCYGNEEELTVAPNRSDEGQMVFFENQWSASPDAFSLINIQGVHCFQVIAGDYDGQNWTNFRSANYSVPRIVLNVTGTDGRRLSIQTDDYELVDNQILDFNILKYNVAGDYYTEQFKVLKYFAGVVELDKDVGDLTGNELHLFVQAASFSFEEGLDIGRSQHVAFRFMCPDSAELKGIGEILIGDFVSLDEYITKVSVSEKSVDASIRTQFGLNLPKRTLIGNVIEDLSVDIPKIQKRDGSFDFIKATLSHLHQRKGLVSFVQQESGNQNRTYLGVVSNPRLTPDSFYYNAAFNLLCQTWKPEPIAKNEIQYPLLQVSVLPSRQQYVGLDISFAGVGVDVAEQQNTAPNWDFGDGTSDSGYSVLKSYSEAGTYNVKATAIDSQGNSSSQFIDVYILESDVISSLSLEVDEPDQNIGLQANFTASALDSSSQVVSDDNWTRIRIDYQFTDESGLTSSVNKGQWYSLTSGQFAFNMTSSVSTTGTVTVKDQFGNTKTINMEWS